MTRLFSVRFTRHIFIVVSLLFTRIALGLSLGFGALGLTSHIAVAMPLTMPTATEALSPYVAALPDAAAEAPPLARMSVAQAPNVCFATHDNGTTVKSSADAQAVRDAIALASAGGTVKVAGYCAGVSGGNVITITKALTVTGGYTTSNWTAYNPAANPTMLDALGAGRVIRITGGVPATLQGLRVTNGFVSGGDGGGIRAFGAITISQSYIFSNTLDGGDGGGAKIDGNAIITDSSFYSNTSTFAGAAYIVGGAVITGSNFYNNRVMIDGGAAKIDGSVVITGSNFYLNSAGRDGGGTEIDDHTIIFSSNFYSNTAGNNGGGAFLGSAVISSSSFYSNTSNGNGGGVYVNDSAEISSSSFHNNTAFNGGGTFIGGFLGGSAVISASNFYRNRANVSGSGAYINGNAEISGSNFYSNLANADGGGAYIVGSAEISSANFYSNTANIDGGGAYIVGSAVISSANFYSNTANASGGGVYAANQTQIENSRFAANTATGDGGAIYLSATPLNKKIVNSLFDKNNAGRGAALFVQDASLLVFVHNTLAAPSPINKPAIYVFAGTIGLTNTLIANYAIGIERAGGTVSEDYTLFDGVSTPYSGTITAGGHSITGTAAFFDTTRYTITLNSFALDTGVNAGIGNDYFGAVRLQGNGFDIGYYESPLTAISNLGIKKTAALNTVMSGATLTYTLIISNNGTLLAPNVVLTEALPAGASFVAGSVITPSGNGTCAATSCNLGHLAAGAYATATFTITVPISIGVITNTAGVTASNDGLTSNNFASVTTTVTEIAITGLAAQNSSPTALGRTTYLTASISAGSNVTYVWAFGDGQTGSGAMVTHIYPAVGVYTAVVTATNSLGSTSVTTTVKIISPPSNEPPPYKSPEPLPPNEDEANIGMQDGGSPPEAAPGEVIALVYRVSLASERNGTSVLFVATLPAGLDFDSVTLQPPGGKCDFIAESGRVECQLGIVTQDRPVTVTLRVRAPQVGRFVVPAQAIGLDTRIVDMPGNNAVQNIIVVSPVGVGQGGSGVRLGSGFGPFVTCRAEGMCVLRWATEGAQQIVRYELVREPVGAPAALLRGGPSVLSIAPKEVDGRASYEVIDSDVLAGRTYDYTVRGVGADGAVHLLQSQRVTVPIRLYVALVRRR